MTLTDNKYIKIIFLGLFALLLHATDARAMVTGVCSNCHTMHDSEAGLSMRQGNTDGLPLPGGSSECKDCHAQLRGILMRYDCLGCHAQGLATASNIVDSTPQILHATTTTALAGGNFKYVFSDDLNGHNAHGINKQNVSPDSNHFNIPPGYDTAFDPSTGKYQPGYQTDQIMCGGQNGCHGNRNEVSQNLAMTGAHHADDSALKFGSLDEAAQGGEVGTSYRYLYKVKGAEASDWEASPTTTDHNEYKGSTFDAARTVESGQAWADIESMSSFCAECHGIFHSGPDLQETIELINVWVRHPSDAVIPDTAPFNLDPSQKYSLIAPVARQTISGASASDSYTPGSDVVFCLSCHRSHASPYPSMLRWDYDLCNSVDDPLKSSCGCYTCHSTY